MTDAQKLTAEKVKQHVQESFDHLRRALDIREKLLLRQYDLLLSQSHKITSINDIKFLRDNENDVLNSIRSFGRFNLSQHNIKNDSFYNEDYICPNNDHDFMLKCLNDGKKQKNLIIDQINNINSSCNNINYLNNNNSQEEKILNTGGSDGDIVTINNNKSFLKENADFINDSIINITLNESKELINKTNNDCFGINTNSIKAKTNKNENDELKKLSPKSNQQQQQSQQQQQHQPATCPILLQKNSELNKSIKNISNLTINNCTGNINLKNISNLTINTCKDSKYNFNEESTSAEDIECNFYNRLLTETKLLKNIPTSTTTTTAAANKTSSHLPSTSTPHLILFSKDIEFKNNKLKFLNNDKKIILEHPVQVQQWLKQIIYETETEPIQTIEILEHSNIDVN